MHGGRVAVPHCVFYDMTSVHYTTHYNWAWVVTDAMSLLQKQLAVQDVILHERFRDMPSCKAAKSKIKPTYALFRLDTTNSNDEITQMVRTRSDIFGFLDPKDSLVRICQLMSVTEFMPETILIPWNWTRDISSDDELATKIRLSLNAGPKLLKAPLGSGGFGLYFVYSLHGESLPFHSQSRSSLKQSSSSSKWIVFTHTNILYVLYHTY